MRYLNETEREEVLQQNEIEYQRQVAFEKEHPDILSWAFLHDLWSSYKFTKFYFLYSWETFWDFTTIVGILAFGLYAFGLMVQTLQFARAETSMIDDMKVKVYLSDKKKYAKEIREYREQVKRRRTLTLEQLLQLVFGESSLFCLSTYIPHYRQPRSMATATQDYLARMESESRKLD